MRHLRILFCGLILTLLAAGSAYAASEGHEPPNLWDLLWRFVTTGLVIAVIWKLAGSKLASFFTGRSEGIARELDDLEARKEKARDDLAEVEKRIAGFESERAAVLAEYEARGEALKAEIVAKAEESAAQIVTQAKQAAQNEIDKALAAVREDLANKIIDAASRSIAGSLNAEDQEKILKDSLNKVVLQ